MPWPTSCKGKVVYHIVPFKMSNLHYNWWEAGQLLKATISPPLEVPPPRYGQIYKIYLAKIQKKSKEITIKNFPTCICLDFVAMIFSSLGQQRSGCLVNTYTMFYNMSCFVANLKVSSIFQLGVVMKFIIC
jgi:hypothetical protein